MDLLRRLNREQGTSFVVVTHNSAVARAADRIVNLRDGRILRDERIGNVYLEDLREFKETALGHAIMDDQVPAELEGLGLDELAGPVREMLKKI